MSDQPTDRSGAGGGAHTADVFDVEASEARRHLAIVAHPDDVDFGAAGTTARLTDAGHEVVYCLVTDGQAGGFDSSVSRTRMAEIRREEQTAAAKVVGVSELHFLAFPDGAVEAGLDLRLALSRIIRIVRPDVVLTQSPERNYDRIYPSHPDHRATGDSAIDAVYPDARNEFAFPELMSEGLEPHVVGEIWLMGGPDPNITVDITDTVDRKIEALLCHRSQIREPDRLPEMIRGWAGQTADDAGLPTGRLAERFRRMATA